VEAHSCTGGKRYDCAVKRKGEFRSPTKTPAFEIMAGGRLRRGGYNYRVGEEGLWTGGREEETPLQTFTRTVEAIPAGAVRKTYCTRKELEGRELIGDSLTFLCKTKQGKVVLNVQTSKTGQPLGLNTA